MYTEIELIKTIESTQGKVGILLLFIEEYSGWIQHLRSIGRGWGSGGEEVEADTEIVKARKHIELLQLEVLKYIM